ncbi:hypothetical protein D350_02031 [Enterococcus faecalis VC1B-1]|nr:hypothetical protein D350_02031 [Enterococcus faecalis VC1B-1]
MLKIFVCQKKSLESYLWRVLKKESKLRMSEIHIKPCPFCGSENISFNAFSISSDAYVLCEQCNANIEISVPWDDMDEKEHDKVCFEKLSILWNNRVSERNQSELNQNSMENKNIYYVN